jgi:hypothetical protein
LFTFQQVPKAKDVKLEVKTKEDSEEKSEEEKKENTEEPEPPRTARKTIRVGKKIQPKLDRITDCLFWKVREYLMM